jgi:bifunctional pyridoxal-dependent enzyme with beta-cystathionase and maltose regulon repressor activities
MSGWLRRPSAWSLAPPVARAPSDAIARGDTGYAGYAVESGDAEALRSVGEWLDPPLGSGGAGHVRLNFATSSAILTEAVRRMGALVEG